MKNEEIITTTKKIIYLPDSNNQNRQKKKEEEEEEEKEKEKKKRMITQTNKWNNSFQNKETDFSKDVQFYWLTLLLEKKEKMEEEEQTRQKIHLLREQIRQKIHNYYFQDMKKQLYNPENFITLEYILQKLKDCNLDCFYCREPVFLWYEIVREPKQWTVERIDNKIGHDIGNIEIACLSCNLKRRCMYHERYVFTKQIKIVKG